MEMEVQCIVFKVTDDAIGLKIERSGQKCWIPRIKDLKTKEPLLPAPTLGTPIIMRLSVGTLGYALLEKKQRDGFEKKTDKD